MIKFISRKSIYLLILLVICLGMLVVNPSLAKFASNYTTDEDVVGLTLSFELGISNIEEYEEIVVDANSYEVFNVNVKNSSDAIVYYGIWYKMVKPKKINDDIIIARLNGTEIETSGSLNSNEDQTVTIIIKNLSSDAVKVNIGVNSSTTSTSDIEYLGGKYLVTGTSNEADYYYDNNNSRYVSVSDNTVVFTANPTNFSYTGDVQTFTAPIAGVYKMEAWGASGGSSYYNVDLTGGLVSGGNGSYASGVLYLKNNEQLYLYVGGKGIDGVSGVASSGGYNGGGKGGTNFQGAGSGGGSTDIRLVNGVWDSISGLSSRIMVAGAGAGASNYDYAVSGGAAGTLIGLSGQLNVNNVTHPLATGGTQTVGGMAGGSVGIGENGVFGKGGNSQPGHGSGGGSGYYGGGGSGYIGSGVSSGAGGSSYVSGYKGAVSAGNPQKFKFIYKNTNGTYVLNGYDQYENLLGTATGTGTINNIDRTLNYIGKSNWSGDGYFYGIIYNLKIKLTNGTVVLHYDFTKNSVNDLSGNNYHGALKNGASLKYDGKRYALVLDGVDDYMQVPTLPSSINFAGGFTVEFEAIWNGLNNYSRVIDFGNGSPSNNILINTYGTNPGIVFQIFNETTALNAVVTSSAIQLNGTNYGKDNQVCETGDSDISCSYHYSGKVFKKANMIAGNASMPTHDGSGTMTGNSGNGYAKITLAVPTIEEDNFVISERETLKLSDITCVDNGSGCKVTRISPGDTSKLSDGTHNIDIMVIDDYGVVYKYTKVLIIDAVPIVANAPNLDNGNLIPVYYDANTADTDGSLGVWKKADNTNANNSWYDYDNKKWANAVLVSGSSIENIAFDMSGNGNHGTINGASLTSEGLSFDGVDDFVVTEELDYQNSTAVTVDFVAKINENDVAVLFESSEDTNYTNNGYFIDTNERGTNDLLFTARDINGYNAKHVNNVIDGTKFKHYTVTFDSTNSYDTFINMYFDGFKSSVDNVDNLNSDISNNSLGNYPLYIASRGGTSFFTNMVLQSLRIYNRELTAEEVASNHNGEVVTDGLILNYDFVNTYNTRRDYYKNASVDTVIYDSDILAFYVWVPRYKYKVWNISRQGGDESTYGYNAYSKGIQLEWEEGTSSTGNVSCSYNVNTVAGENNLSDVCTYGGNTITTESSNKVDAWYTHPAFNFGGTPKTGFWIGKFETSGSADAPTIVPDVVSLREQNVSTQFTTSKVFQSYGLSSSVDAHMLTNLEWGAVAYLTHSIYGLCDGTSCRDVYINNSSSKFTGRSGGYLAGDEKLQLTNFYGSSVTTDTTMYNTNGYYTYRGYEIDNSGIVSTTEKDESKVGSTTGNVTGVYDMSGGAYEYVMGNMVDSTGAFYPSSSGTSWNDISILDIKYYNSYSYGESAYDQIAFNRARLGDATSENTGSSSNGQNSWKPSIGINKAGGFLPNLERPWFDRGGYYNDSSAGIFNFGLDSGVAYMELSFRSSIS